MKAAIYQQPGKPLKIEVVDDPRPRPTDIIIKTHRCGICGTDLHLTSGTEWDFPLGSIPGHEFAGEIVEIGSAVEGFKKGDIVTAIPTAGCGHCEACFRHNTLFCESVETFMGGFGEYMYIPQRSALKLPKIYSLADGALVEPFAVGLYVVRAAALGPAERVLVIGGGTVALTTTFWAKRLGAGRVVAASRSQRRAALCKQMGADAFVQMGETEIQDVVEALGGPPTTVFECVGATGLLAQAIQHVARFGQVVSAGFCTTPDPVIPALASNKAVRMSFPVGYHLRDFQYAADMMFAGDIDPKAIISSVIPFAELPKVFEMLRGPNNETKVQVLVAGT